MIRSFGSQATADIYHGLDTKAARRACPRALWGVAGRKLDQLHAAVSLASLQLPPGNRLESLHGDRTGRYSIRINAQYRVCFIWTAAGPAAVTIVDYH